MSCHSAAKRDELRRIYSHFIDQINASRPHTGRHGVHWQPFSFAYENYHGRHKRKSGGDGVPGTVPGSTDTVPRLGRRAGIYGGTDARFVTLPSLIAPVCIVRILHKCQSWGTYVVSGPTQFDDFRNYF